MNNADFKEVALRIITVKQTGDKDEKRTITVNGNSDQANSSDSSKMPTLVVRLEAEKNGAKTKIWDGSESMYVSVQRGIHEKLDSIQGISHNILYNDNRDSIRENNFMKFDSLLRLELSQIDINIPYYLEYVDIKTDSVLTRIPKTEIDRNKGNYEEFKFPFDLKNSGAYHLYLENPRWHIFKNMLTLIVSSILMVICLIGSYIYLLKVILRQKTVDEIKGDFVNNMTHELKTPISITYAAVDTLQNFEIGDDPLKRNKYLAISKEQLMYLNSLVEQILTMSVEERKNMKLSVEVISIQEIFAKMERQFLLNATKDIKFSIQVRPETLSIEADRIHFVNVINNLIENAIKYSDDSVCISLTAERINNKTIMAIKDNGIGIPHASLNKIFDKFYRVSTGNIHNVKGYGLGLSYVKTIVEKHGWIIKVESIERKGSCFKIEI